MQAISSFYQYRIVSDEKLQNLTLLKFVTPTFENNIISDNENNNKFTYSTYLLIL